MGILHKFITIITKIQNTHKHNDKPIEQYTSNIDSTCDTIVLIKLGVTILRLIFRLHKKVVRNGSKAYQIKEWR
jgi:hypothetical protein